MKVPWFKHYSGSLEDPDLYDAMQKFGDAAYVIYFGILELMSQEMDIDEPGKVEISIPHLEHKLRREWCDIRYVLAFFSLRNRFTFSLKTVQKIKKIVISSNKYKNTMSAYCNRKIKHLRN